MGNVLVSRLRNRLLRLSSLDDLVMDSPPRTGRSVELQGRTASGPPHLAFMQVEWNREGSAAEAGKVTDQTGRATLLSEATSRLARSKHLATMGQQLDISTYPFYLSKQGDSSCYHLISVLASLQRLQGAVRQLVPAPYLQTQKNASLH